MDNHERHLLRCLYCLLVAGQIVIMLFLASQHTTAGWAAFCFVMPFLVIDVFYMIRSFVTKDDESEDKSGDE